MPTEKKSDEKAEAGEAQKVEALSKPDKTPVVTLPRWVVDEFTDSTGATWKKAAEAPKRVVNPLAVAKDGGDPGAFGAPPPELVEVAPSAGRGGSDAKAKASGKKRK